MENLAPSMPEFIMTGALDRFDGTYAVIITADKQTLLWPIKNLPDNVKEGDVLKLHLTTDKLETAHKEQAVRNLLNQILKK